MEKLPRPTSRLLATLPKIWREKFIAACDVVDLTFDQVLAQPGQVIKNVYFPLDSFISQLTTVAGPHLEIALTGNEGMLGLPIVLGGTTSTVRAVVQGKGAALQMRVRPFRNELAKSSGLRLRLMRYVSASLAQIGYMAACNKFHTISQRLARWLLMTADRAHSETFHITHEYLAFMLGVRRVGITQAAGMFQEQGLIRYTRGRIAILDRRGLERACCKCYQASIDVYDEALGQERSAAKAP